ncbi:hypothetical protein IE077_004158 [Cardiosporidium cionae]|uniref:Uncharacterized protein n=1 Tax=Cardiosporidium cionae TaxID=476202 RepID=A0ABQ7JGF0_9APIC|nr:hypothetical protein IE077_004158 [Cardiosporidium cionae]|eukprot:KAF8823096.1 hypothetical protein IE077_004158 [Cardiosporidium cionae]
MFNFKCDRATELCAYTPSALTTNFVFPLSGSISLADIDALPYRFAGNLELLPCYFCFESESQYFWVDLEFFSNILSSSTPLGSWFGYIARYIADTGNPHMFILYKHLKPRNIEYFLVNGVFPLPSDVALFLPVLNERFCLNLLGSSLWKDIHVHLALFCEILSKDERPMHACPVLFFLTTSDLLTNVQLAATEPFSNFKKLRKYGHQFRISVNYNFRAALYLTHIYKKAAYLGTWLTPALIDILCTLHDMENSANRSYRDDISSSPSPLVPITLWAFELWEASTHQLLAAVLTYGVGYVACDYTALTVHRDYRSCGSILTHVVGDILQKCGYVLWDWGQCLNYMLTYQAVGATSMPTSVYLFLWQTYARRCGCSNRYVFTKNVFPKNLFDCVLRSPQTIEMEKDKIEEVTANVENDRKGALGASQNVEEEERKRLEKSQESTLKEQNEIEEAETIKKQIATQTSDEHEKRVSREEMPWSQHVPASEISSPSLKVCMECSSIPPQLDDTPRDETMENASILFKKRNSHGIPSTTLPKRMLLMEPLPGTCSVEAHPSLYAAPLNPITSTAELACSQEATHPVKDHPCTSSSRSSSSFNTLFSGSNLSPGCSSTLCGFLSGSSKASAGTQPLGGFSDLLKHRRLRTPNEIITNDEALIAKLDFVPCADDYYIPASFENSYISFFRSSIPSN